MRKYVTERSRDRRHIGTGMHSARRRTECYQVNSTLVVVVLLRVFVKWTHVNIEVGKEFLESYVFLCFKIVFVSADCS